jgi:hyaluronan synthase
MSALYPYTTKKARKDKKMKTKTESKQRIYSFRADSGYPWLLFCAAVSAGVFLWWQIDGYIQRSAGIIEQSWMAKDYIAAGLSCLAILALFWRICFACRYRPYEPVADWSLPTITVIIPAYNEGAQILHTVRSVMASRYPAKKMQVICVDDGSHDDTWQWMKLAFQEFPWRVRLIRLHENSGKRNALMAGFAQATGQIYITIDSDSEVLPDTLRHMVSPMVRESRVGAVAGNVRVLNIAEGSIPKMMEVSFTSAFDFIRSGQSVYGGVFCTPGALSAYRAAVIKPHLQDWTDQRFMDIPAGIGEDRALTNLVLGLGYRVVYQRNAVVLTKVPTTFTGLRRMLLRWARSNVRENLVMVSFLTRRFRVDDTGGGWLRLFGATQMLRMVVGEALKVAVLFQLVQTPLSTLALMTVGCFISSIVPAFVHQRRYGGWFGWRWAVPFSFFWLFALSWIPVWGMITAPRSGWLTRCQPKSAKPTVLIPSLQHKKFPKAA